MVSAADICKRYKGNANMSLRDVSLDVLGGDIIAVVGHNGAGKSTLFDILGGLISPSAGSVTRNVDSSKIGWCPQREIIDWSLTVRQNISLGVQLRTGGSLASVKESVAVMAEYLGLERFLDRTAETLSGGELRRTQIARAMAGSPELLILDEPTTGLDPEGIRRVFAYLDEQRSKGVAALISTHETSRFSAHCTRVWAIHRGRLVCDLPVEEFMSAAPESSADLWDAYVSLTKDLS